MSFSLFVLIAVFLGIALRQVCRLPFRIWQWMALGAVVVLMTGQIGFREAAKAVDWDIILFLFGMFIIGQVMEESGYLATIIARCSLDYCHPAKLAAVIVFGMGLLSALLMNDTLAIIGTPLLLRVAKGRGIAARPLLLGLAFAITTGSVLTPIGNPQNLLIALQAPIEKPFITFITHLGIPTLINLGLVYGLTLTWIYRQPKKVAARRREKKISLCDDRMVWLCHLALIAILLLVGYRFLASWFDFSTTLPLPWIALAPAFGLLVASPKKTRVITRLDWQTLIFFIALFILMASVWKTSTLKNLLLQPSWATTTLPGILTMSTLLSQLISNVPLVALYLPILQSYAPTLAEWMALAAGSTIAGNLLIFGSASNLIIIQSSEKRGGYLLSFFTFAKYGIPITMIQLGIYWIFMSQ